MMTFPSSTSLEAVWLSALEAAEATRDGRVLHAVLATAEPQAPLTSVVALNDALLTPRGDHSVDTVANTLFPANLYSPPNLDYSPGLPPEETPSSRRRRRWPVRDLSRHAPGLVHLQRQRAWHLLRSFGVLAR